MPGETSNRTTSITVNELGWIGRIDYPDGLYETASHDKSGNVTNSVDRAGRTNIFTYLPTRKLSSVLRPLSSGITLTNRVEYDNQFNTLKIYDAKNRPVETYALDLQDRVTGVTNLEGQTMTVTYGAGDFVRQIDRFDGTTVTNTIDTDGRITSMKYPGTTNTFSYLKNNLLLTAGNEVCSVSNSWSYANRLTNVLCDFSAGGGPASGGQVSYSYYAAGQVSNVVSLAGTNTYTLDNADRVSATDFASIGVNLRFQNSYNTNNGLLSEMLCTNTGIKVEYGCDVMDRVTNIVWRDNTSNVLASFAYFYNNASMITQKVSIVNGQVSTNIYGCDDLDRLISEIAPSCVIQYSYDEVGNRTAKTNGDTSVSYSYSNGCNRLLSWNATSTNTFVSVRKLDVFGSSTETIGTNVNLGQLYISNSAAITPSVSTTNFWKNYFAVGQSTQEIIAAIGDAAGNVSYATNQIIVHVITNTTYLYNTNGCVTNIAYSGSNYSQNIGLTWNSQYQLTEVTTNGTAVERNGFDALRCRVWTWDGTETNYFVYDGAHVLAEVDSTGGLRRAYTHGPGIDNWLAMTVYTGATAKTYFYLTDIQGSVMTVVDEYASVVEQYRYDTWGRVLGVYDGAGNPLTQSAIGNRFLWQGREYSWKTGLYYFRARWYEPVTGRWLSNDSIGMSGGLNQYVFCGNNPVNFVDPWGLQEMINVETQMRLVKRHNEIVRQQAAATAEGTYLNLASGGLGAGGGLWLLKTKHPLLAGGTAALAITDLYFISRRMQLADETQELQIMLLYHELGKMELHGKETREAIHEFLDTYVSLSTSAYDAYYKDNFCIKNK